jgi:hypothetical protein
LYLKINISFAVSLKMENGDLFEKSGDEPTRFQSFS